MHLLIAASLHVLHELWQAKQVLGATPVFKYFEEGHVKQSVLIDP